MGGVERHRFDVPIRYPSHGRGAAIRVLIVEDQRLFADVIRSALESRGVDVVGIAADGDEAIRAAKDSRPDVVLVDVGLGADNGIAVGKRILAEQPESKLLAVTAVNEAKLVGEAIRAGFSGYVTKDTKLSSFVSHIEAVMRGAVVTPQRLAGETKVLRTEQERHAAFLARQLSARELEVLALLAEGLGSRDIAQRLKVTPNTVRTHVQSVLTKLQVHSRLEAAAFATRHGLIDPSRGNKRTSR